MKKVLVLSTICFALLTNAQEVGLSIGSSTFLGDVGGNRGKGETFLKDLQVSQLHPAIGFSFTCENITLSYLYSHLSGADSTIKNRGGAENGRLVRGFYFSTPLSEITITTKKFIGPLFVTLGAGAMAFHKGLQVERRYHSIQPLIIYGVGYRCQLSEDLALQVEASGRKLFTDYIDDVSLRGDPKQNDSYVTALASLVFTGLFKKDYLPCPKWK